MKNSPIKIFAELCNENPASKNINLRTCKDLLIQLKESVQESLAWKKWT